MSSVLGVRANSYLSLPISFPIKNQRNINCGRLQSNPDVFVKNSSQISFGAMPSISDPYAIPCNMYGFVDDLFMDDGLTKCNYSDAIRLMVRSGRLDDLKRASDNAKNYTVYDGVGTYEIDLKKNAPRLISEELIQLGRVKEVMQFLPLFADERRPPLKQILEDFKLSEADKTAYGLQTHNEALKNLETDKEKKQYFDDLAKKTKKARNLAVKTEAVKDQLRPFIGRLSSDYCGRPARFPNCIMLTGNNNYALKDILSWLKEAAQVSNFVKIDAHYNCDVLQSKLYRTLKEAEQNYKATGKRSIIYVDHLDRLINKKINTPENIAGMKRVMCNADEKYHSTIIFCAKPDDISDFEPGAIKSHRVGLKVNVPISLSDMDLLHV